MSDYSGPAIYIGDQPCGTETTCFQDESMRVFGTQVVKCWTGDTNVVGIFQGVVTESAEGGPISKLGGSGSAGWEL